jgi:hypothetical protein
MLPAVHIAVSPANEAGGGLLYFFPGLKIFLINYWICFLYFIF